MKSYKIKISPCNLFFAVIFLMVGGILGIHSPLLVAANCLYAMSWVLSTTEINEK